MGLLKTEPAGVVESMPELMAIAKAMEDEAASRYRQLARRMQSLGNKAAEGVFVHLAHEEETHAARVAELSQAIIGTEPSFAEIRWELPKDLEDEGMPDLGVSRLVTPYRALSIAVRNEERAFAFWSYVSAYSQSELIREYAEKMAREELRHASILRKERRRAYHEGSAAGGQPASGRSRIWSMAALNKEAATLENRILETCRKQLPAAATKEDETTTHVLARICEESARNLQALGLTRGDLTPAGSQEDIPPVVILDRAIAATEAAAGAYLQAAESAADESVVLTAQKLSRSAITRLVALRERRAELAPAQSEHEP